MLGDWGHVLFASGQRSLLLLDVQELLHVRDNVSKRQPEAEVAFEMSLKLDIALEPDSRLTGKAVLICFLSSSLILLNVFAVMEIGRKRC